MKLLVDLASRPFETLTFINNSSSTFLIPALLVLVSGLAAGKITSSLTKVSLFRVCEFLVKGLPAPVMTGMILTLEFIVMLVYWSPGGLHEKERLAVQGTMLRKPLLLLPGQQRHNWRQRQRLVLMSFWRKTIMIVLLLLSNKKPCPLPRNQRKGEIKVISLGTDVFGSA